MRTKQEMLMDHMAENNISQSQLAGILGTTQAAVNNWLKKPKPSNNEKTIEAYINKNCGETVISTRAEELHEKEAPIVIRYDNSVSGQSLRFDLSPTDTGADVSIVFDPPINGALQARQYLDAYDLHVCNALIKCLSNELG